MPMQMGGAGWAPVPAWGPPPPAYVQPPPDVGAATSSTAPGDRSSSGSPEDTASPVVGTATVAGSTGSGEGGWEAEERRLDRATGLDGRARGQRRDGGGGRGDQESLRHVLKGKPGSKGAYGMGVRHQACEEGERRAVPRVRRGGEPGAIGLEPGGEPAAGNGAGVGGLHRTLGARGRCVGTRAAAPQLTPCAADGGGGPTSVGYRA